MLTVESPYLDMAGIEITFSQLSVTKEFVIPSRVVTGVSIPIYILQKTL